MTLQRDSRGFATSAQGASDLYLEAACSRDFASIKTSLPASFLPACCLATPRHRGETVEQDGTYVFHKRKALQVQLNLGNFTDHRVEEVKGVPDAFLTVKKCIL